MAGQSLHRIPRRFIAACFIAGGCVAAGCAPPPQSANEPERPNVLLILTDDQRYTDVGAFSDAELETPVMDSLAGSGVSMTHAYIMGGTSPAVCAPSRAMLHTGRSLFRIAKQGRWQFHIPEEHVTIPEAFRAAGYHTYGIGKQHNGKEVFNRGFVDGGKIFFGGMDEHLDMTLFDYDPQGRYTDTLRNVVGLHSSSLFSDEAADFLEEYDGEQPFFLYIAYTAPHDPRTVPESYDNPYGPDAVDLPPNFLPEHPFDNGELEIRDELLAEHPRTAEEVRRHIADYYAITNHMDDGIGRVMTALRRSGHADDTIVALAGDNGLAVGQHGLMGKQNLYEHSIHVPLIFSGPGVPSATERDGFVYLFDVFPTLAELAGVTIPASVEGESLVPMFRGDATARDDAVFGYMDFQRAVRHGDLKLIEYLVDGTRTTQLFDLSEDPWEMNDLADRSDRQADVERLRSRLVEMLESSGDTSQLLEALRSETTS